MAARSRVKRRLKTRVKRGAKAPAGRSPVAKKDAPQKPAPQKPAPKKAVAKKPARKPSRTPQAKKPEADSRIVEAALAAFAHEVRTPLTGILAISSLLATSELGEREKRWVDTIKAGAEHLAALATLFVDAARSGSTGLAVRRDFFDLRTLSRTLGDSLAGRASAKGLQSQVGIAEDLPAFVIGDPVRLRAALENLIDNAVKFTQQGNVALDVSVKAGEGGRNRAGDLVRRGNVAARPCRTLSPVGNILGDNAPRPGPGSDDHVRAFGRQSHGDTASDSGPRAGDQYRVALKSHGNITEPPSTMTVSPTTCVMSDRRRNLVVATTEWMRPESSCTAAAVR